MFHVSYMYTSAEKCYSKNYLTCDELRSLRTRVSEGGTNKSQSHEKVNLNAHISNDIFLYAIRK